MHFRPIRSILSSLFLLASIQLYPSLFAHAANNPIIQEFAAPLKSENLKNIVASPDGTIWLSMENTNTIEHFDPKTGKFQLYHTFTASSYPESIAVDGTGNLWFSSQGDNRAQKIVIGRITTSGQILKDYPTSPQYNGHNEAIGDMARGKDGNLWFTDQFRDEIGRIVLTNKSSRT